ncbi:MAG: DUF480 domain-containing protein [Deltaproteobacteria bacterium]|nr:DUF480 domain-containing protein [Deltaproteobacteria bacterium]
MDPEVRLQPLEARLLGVLVEKALTTPEGYPLSLNAAVLGANQKSNRDPVLALSDDEVSDALDGLIDKQLVRKVFPGASRVDKYAHTGTSTLKVEISQLALLAELLMRGPQSLAELRARTARMVPIDTAERLHELLDPLEARGMVARVPAGHGSRVERVVQCLCPDLHPLETHGVAPAASPGGAPEEASVATRAALAERITALEATVERLQRQLRGLAGKLGEPLED